MVLYKYTRARHLESILKNGTLALPLVSQLNDPCESSIQSALEFARSLHQLPPLAYKPIVRVGNIPDAINPLFDESLPKIEENDKSRKHNRGLERIIQALESFRKTVGVISFTTDPLNAVMWAHYAASSTGACVGIDVDNDFFAKFESPLHGDFPNLFKPSPMVYKSVRPTYDQAASVERYIYDAFFTKFTDWSYEKEYRLLRPIDASMKNSQSPIALYSIPRVCITSVFLGLAAAAPLLNCSLDITENTGCDVYVVETPINEYSLNAKPIRKNGWLLQGSTPTFRQL